MRTQKIVKEIHRLLLPTLAAKGFDGYESKDNYNIYYTRLMKGGWHRVIIGLNGRPGELIPIFGLQVRIDRIIDLLYPVDFIGHGDQSVVIGNMVSRYSNGQEFSWIFKLEDVHKPVQYLIDFLEREGFGWLERYTSVDDIDKELNRPDRPRDLFISETNRWYKGLVAAVLNKNPEAAYWHGYYRNCVVAYNSFSPVMLNKYDELTEMLVREHGLRI